MTLHGKISNGVVVLDEAVALPEGTLVEVFVSPAQSAPATTSEKMSEIERQRVLAILDRIAALPIEGPDDGFSGADHDKVLYGKP